MARKQKKPGSGRQKPRLPHQTHQKPVPHPTQQTRARILAHLGDAVGACEDLFNDHGEDCQCETCCLVSNLVGSVRVFQMLLEIT